MKLEFWLPRNRLWKTAAYACQNPVAWEIGFFPLGDSKFSLTIFNFQNCPLQTRISNKGLGAIVEGETSSIAGAWRIRRA